MSNKENPVVESDDLVDEVVERLMDRADASGAALLGEGGLLTEVTRAVLERAREAETSGHLGYEKHDPAGQGSDNSRNGTSPKTVLTDAGAVTLAVPRDRNAEFDPKIVPKSARRPAGFNDRILSLYARAMSVRDIRSHLTAICGVEVSPDLISTVTDAVVDELAAWQNRPLNAVWPIIYIDALWVRIRSGRWSAGWSTWPSGSTWTAARTCWDCGSAPKARAPRPGWRCSRSCASAASRSYASPPATVSRACPRR